MTYTYPGPGEILEAIDSGKFTRGRGALRTKNGGYCCLGVGCKLALVEDELLDDEGFPSEVAVIWDRSVNWLSEVAPEWLCKKASDYAIDGDDPHGVHKSPNYCRTVGTSLAVLNDQGGNWLPVKNALRRLEAERAM